jgi:hypothetical protein
LLIADNEDELSWHAFLGHSIDMQGFRAAEFAGVDALTKAAPDFTPLKRLGIGVPELGALWEIAAIRQHLLTGTKKAPLNTTLDLLKKAGGKTGHLLAEAFERFPYRKGHWTVRALLQNAFVLKESDYSFRRWLQSTCTSLGAATFPPDDFRQAVVFKREQVPLEKALRFRLEETFYMVGTAMSAYMLCDWQLGLWCEGRTAVFANFKLDSFHQQFVARYGQGRIPPDEDGFAQWWLALYPELPPRLANECIWLGVENRIV